MRVEDDFSEADVQWMLLALDNARQAEQVGEVPVGAALVRGGQLLATAYNQPISKHDPGAHAELLVLRLAGQQEANYRLPGTTLYVTLEPCTMCAGAMIHARIDRLVYAAHDPKTGAAGSVFDVLNDSRHNHRVVVQGGLLADESSLLLKRFFKARR